MSADRDHLRQQLAEEMTAHTDVIFETDDGRFRYGCTCGHERGVFTEAEVFTRLRTRAATVEQRQHVADALLPVVEAHTREMAATELVRMAELLERNYDRGPARRCRNRATALRTHEGDTDG